jgi:hypothetical protein
MPLMMNIEQQALLSAALRHQEDAEDLLCKSPDQSWHLAGYAVECVRKACPTIEPHRRALAHEHGKDADALLEVVMALDSRVARLRLQGWAPQTSMLAKWDEQHRYDRRGQHASDAPALVQETAVIHDRTLTALWLAAPFNPGML